MVHSELLRNGRDYDFTEDGEVYFHTDFVLSETIRWIRDHEGLMGSFSAAAIKRQLKEEFNRKGGYVAYPSGIRKRIGTKNVRCFALLASKVEEQLGVSVDTWGEMDVYRPRARGAEVEL
jgi:hypothetical protein